jgi:DNA-directed RNA polymerase specialized sigma24 family protein
MSPHPRPDSPANADFDLTPELEAALNALARDATEPGDDAQLILGALTSNERRLLALRLSGYSLNAAAERLGWSPRTTARRWHALRRRLARGKAIGDRR